MKGQVYPLRAASPFSPQLLFSPFPPRCPGNKFSSRPATRPGTRGTTLQTALGNKKRARVVTRATLAETPSAHTNVDLPRPIRHITTSDCGKVHIRLRDHRGGGKLWLVSLLYQYLVRNYDGNKTEICLPPEIWRHVREELTSYKELKGIDPGEGGSLSLEQLGLK